MKGVRLAYSVNSYKVLTHNKVLFCFTIEGLYSKLYDVPMAAGCHTRLYGLIQWNHYKYVRPLYGHAAHLYSNMYRCCYAVAMLLLCC